MAAKLQVEVRVSGALAIRLGARPVSPAEHRARIKSGRFLLLRDRQTGMPLFWEIAPPSRVSGPSAPRQ